MSLDIALQTSPMGPLTMNNKPVKCPHCGCMWGIVVWTSTYQIDKLGLREYVTAIICGMCGRELT